VTQPVKPVPVPPVVTETPPVTVAPVVIPYWIIGAVLGPILLFIIIVVLIIWRWKSGSPTKVQPSQQKPDIVHKPMVRMDLTVEIECDFFVVCAGSNAIFCRLRIEWDFFVDICRLRIEWDFLSIVSRILFMTVICQLGIECDFFVFCTAWNVCDLFDIC